MHALSRRIRWAIVNAMTARRSRATHEAPKPNSTEPGPSAAAERALSADDDAPPFEEGLSRLEGLVAKLEGGELPLEGALGAFEEGVRLSRQLDRQLNEAEQRVELLLREGGRWVTEPLDPLTESGGDGEREV